MLFLFTFAAAGSAAAAALAAPQITAAPNFATLAKRADATDSSYLSAASSLCVKNNWDCCSLTTGPLAAPTPDTASSFVANPSFSSLAVNAPTPTGYTSTFTNAEGSIQQSFGYRGYTQLSSYDPNQCAAFCNQDDLCRGFNIYVQREPILRPAYSVCTDPPSTGAIGCTRWGYPINQANATNDGSWQASFRVAIAGSNGYNRNHENIPEKALPNFAAPVNIYGAAIQDDSYYMVVDHKDQSAFDPAICATDCQENTAYNQLHSNGEPYITCVGHYFTVLGAETDISQTTFNAYISLKNGIAEGTRCVLFSQAVSNIAQKATNTGETRGTDVYTIGESYAYVLNSS